MIVFFSSRRRHTRSDRDWSSDVCSSDLALATGNNARIFRLARGTGTITVGAPADLVVCDAPAASLAKDALDAIARGDIPGISCVVIDGRVRVGRSRNTPLAKRLATFTGVSIDGGGHA